MQCGCRAARHQRAGYRGECQQRRERRQQEVALTGEQARRERPADEHDEPEVGHAREHEERRGAPCDLLVGHAAAFERPCSERQAAGAACGQDRVRSQLGHPDFGAHAPVHPAAERHPEDGDVAHARCELQDHSGRQPRRVRALEARTKPVQAGQQRDERDDDDADPEQQHDLPAQPTARQGVGHRQFLRAESLGDGAVLRRHGIRGGLHGCGVPVADTGVGFGQRRRALGHMASVVMFPHATGRAAAIVGADTQPVPNEQEMTR